jgi:hypothetical protein
MESVLLKTRIIEYQVTIIYMVVQITQQPHIHLGLRSGAVLYCMIKQTSDPPRTAMQMIHISCHYHKTYIYIYICLHSVTCSRSLDVYDVRWNTYIDIYIYIYNDPYSMLCYAMLSLQLVRFLSVWWHWHWLLHINNIWHLFSLRLRMNELF